MFIVIISVLIGAFSHVLWDSFTHETGFFVVQFPILKAPINVHHWTIPLYKIFQHLSSLLGALFIIITLQALKKNIVSVRIHVYKYWSFVLVISMTVVAMRFGFGLSFTQYGNIVITGISGGLFALIVTPLILGRE